MKNVIDDNRLRLPHVCNAVHYMSNKTKELVAQIPDNVQYLYLGRKHYTNTTKRVCLAQR
jgi:hypothetical protein